MTPAPSRLLAVVFGILCVASALPASGDGPESVARRYLAGAYDGRFDELPKVPDARTAPFERQVRNILRVRCIRVDGVAVSPVDERPEQTTLDADVALAKRDPLASGSWSAVEVVPLRVVLARQDQTWLVAEVLNRDDLYAERFLKAAAAERERLWREEPQRLSRGLARALYARALACLNAGAFNDAADASEMARRVAVEVGDRGGEALALGNATHSAQPKDIQRLSDESLAIAEAAGDPDILARAWYDRGRALIRMVHLNPAWRHAETLESYRKARALAARAEDPSILIRILYSFANIAANRADYLSARRYIDEGLTIAREVEDLTGEMGLEMVLATIYSRQGDGERSLVHHALATELAEKTQSFAYSTLLASWACQLVDLGRYDEARAMFDRVLVRTGTGMTTRIKSMPGRHTGSALRALARIEADSGNFSEAECLNRETAIFHDGNTDRYLYELAPYYARGGHHAGALAFSLASLGAEGLYDDQRATALISAGRAYRDLGMTDRGLAAALEAIDLRESIDTKTAGDERQRAFAANITSDAYELAAELTLIKGKVAEALALLERGRARVLTGILENGRPEGAAELDADVREQESAFDREVSRITMQLERVQTAGGETGDLTARLNRARGLRASFLDGVSVRSERRNAVHRTIDASSVTALAARLPHRTVAVEYFIGDHDLYLFVLSGGAGEPRVRVRTKHVERKHLDERVRVFLEMLASSDLRVEAPARELYTLLIEPIEQELAGADAVFFVPDDNLWNVPFSALVDRRGRYLVERKAIVYASSMTAWASIADIRKNVKSAPVTLLAIANPTLDPTAGKVAASFYRSATLGALPDAEHEVDAVRSFYDRRQSVVLKRELATEARTKAALHDATVVHFATHAILDDANPMYSRLMLARDGAAEEDGWLESWEVARLDLNADLVVLAACETARGGAGGGEGVVGLSWSFFLAGASSTLASQWKVASDSTAQFMIDFHRALRAPAADPALHKAQALRDAQLQSIRKKETAHPFHWAAFVLLGDPSVRVEP